MFLVAMTDNGPTPAILGNMSYALIMNTSADIEKETAIDGKKDQTPQQEACSNIFFPTHQFSGTVRPTEEAQAPDEDVKGRGGLGPAAPIRRI